MNGSKEWSTILYLEKIISSLVNVEWRELDYAYYTTK